jgi:uncharacterized membrane protein YgdD (TMEM256/DUF423 family)
MKPKQILLCGAVFGALGVSLGAFGAHWLTGAVQGWGLDADEQARRLETWEVAVRYQLYHALALLIVGLLGLRNASRSLAAAGGLFLIGVTIFSGCLYALVLSGVKILGAIVPIGGACLIAGWVLLAIGVHRTR